jgi:general secretion pathway protein I
MKFQISHFGFRIKDTGGEGVPPGKHCKNGFTLMEVLVALAILGIGLTIIQELFSGGLRSARISEEYTKAVWYGKAKMEEMLTTKNLAEGVTEDAFDSQFSWKSEVIKANPSVGQEGNVEASLPVNLYKIMVKVTWRSGLGQRNVEMESLRAFKPKGENK